jgi:hypothetical protein
MKVDRAERVHRPDPTRRSGGCGARATRCDEVLAVSSSRAAVRPGVLSKGGRSSRVQGPGPWTGPGEPCLLAFRRGVARNDLFVT